MSQSVRRDLPVTVTFRVTPEQARLLEEAARPLSPGQYSRRIALAAARIDGPQPGRRPLPKVHDAALLQAALAELGHIGGNLNQIAHLLNMGRPLGDWAVEAIRADLLPIRDRLMTALVGADD